jgi:hypothetical protein
LIFLPRKNQNINHSLQKHISESKPILSFSYNPPTGMSLIRAFGMCTSFHQTDLYQDYTHFLSILLIIIAEKKASGVHTRVSIRA